MHLEANCPCGAECSACTYDEADVVDIDLEPIHPLDAVLPDAERMLDDEWERMTDGGAVGYEWTPGPPVE